MAIIIRLDRMMADRKILLNELSEKAMADSKQYFSAIDDITRYNQQKMLKAFQNAGVSESHFTGSTGYGYDDIGREAIENILMIAIILKVYGLHSFYAKELLNVIHGIRAVMILFL